jgi:hypothetical protein
MHLAATMAGQPRSHGFHPVRIVMPVRARLIVIATLLCTACASTPEATRDRDAEAKEFEPVTRDAVIYIYRPGPALSGPETTLWLDGRLVGSSLPGTFFRAIAFPGRNVIDTSPPDTGRIEVSTAGNDVTFVEMRTLGAPDGTPRTHFRVVSPEAGKAAIRACCRRLEVWRPGQPRLLF